MTIDAVLAFCAFGALVYFFYGPWQTLCTDCARQLLFEERDALFDIARQGRISFDDPSYRMMRKSIQGLIRFTHAITIPRMIYLALTLTDVKGDGSGLRLAVMSVENSELRLELNRIANHIAVIMTVCVFVRSIFIFPLLPILMALFIAHWFERCKITVRRQVKQFGDLIQREAELTS